MNLHNLFTKLKGSSRSGNFGHSGRPGKRGGSAPVGSSLKNISKKEALNFIKNSDVPYLLYRQGSKESNEKLRNEGVDTLKPRGRFGAFLYASKIPIPGFGEEKLTLAFNSNRTLTLPSDQEKQDQLLDKLYEDTNYQPEKLYDAFIFPHPNSENVEIAIFNPENLRLVNE